MATPNPYLLAADNSPSLLPLLRENSALATSQDEHGYSLVHAAASYNHLDLLRSLVSEFKVDVDLKDEDGETALFVVETPEAAKVLVEELGADSQHLNAEGQTARSKIEMEGDFPAVAVYLANFGEKKDSQGNGLSTAVASLPESLPLPPDGMSLTVGTMDQIQDVPLDVDPDFRQRIQELASRDDFNSPQGQSELRRLVEDAIQDQGLGDDRKVRTRQES
jgi:ankyrin repeat protein